MPITQDSSPPMKRNFSIFMGSGRDTNYIELTSTKSSGKVVLSLDFRGLKSDIEERPTMSLRNLKWNLQQIPQWLIANCKALRFNLWGYISPESSQSSYQRGPVKPLHRSWKPSRLALRYWRTETKGRYPVAKEPEKFSQARQKVAIVDRVLTL